MRFLCLHGYGQSAETFRQRTGSLRKAMKRCEFTFLDAPHAASADFLTTSSAHDRTERGTDGDAGAGWGADAAGDGRAAVIGAGPVPLGWWNAAEAGTRPSLSRAYAGLDDSLARVREAVERDGPYDGLLGFSQGATLAALFLLLAAPTPDSPPPVRCAILVAGFLPRDASILEQLQARASVHPLLAVPTLHVAGETDGFVPIESTRALAAAFEHPVLFLHPGGHGIPTGAGFRAAVVEFLASVPDD